MENETDNEIKKLMSILEDKGLKNLYDELSKELQSEILCDFLDMIGYEVLKKMSREEIIEDTIFREILNIKNNLLKDINLKAIKQIEQTNNIYTVLQNGYLYKDDNLLDTDISMLHFINGDIYKIKSNNIILPLNNTLKKNLDYYLNNNNYKYKKIISNRVDLVALTQEGDVRAFIVNCGFGIIPENYKNVEDIFFDNKVLNEKNSIQIPYIIKNKKQIPLNLQF